ncbi:MAG: hypothetical protein QXP68_04370 [Thermosphaera sp.]
MNFLASLISIIYNVLFLRGEEGFRRASSLPKLMFIMTVITLMIRNPERLFILGILVIALGAYHPGVRWLYSTLFLTGILGTYMSLSTLISNLLGWSNLSSLEIILIALRTIVVSSNVIFIFVIISPTSLTNLMKRVGIERRFVHMPMLVWRLVPYGIRWFTDSLMIGYLKKEKATARLPVVAAGVLEMGRFVEEYCYYRLNAKLKNPIILVREQYIADILLSVSSFIILLLL